MSDNNNDKNSQELLSNENTASNQYKDFSGIDTESFILTTLKTNAKDRNLILSIEKTLREFIENNDQTTYQFQSMNSYERMLVHRVAAYFGLDHNVDKNGQAIIVTKTSSTRIPDLLFESITPTEDATERQQPIRNNRISYSNRSLDNREKFPNRNHRKQQRFNGNQHATNIQSTSQFINPRNQTVYYPLQSNEHNYKQPTISPSMYNYIPMMSSNSYQPANNLSVPIFLQQQPTGQIQYVFPAQTPMSSDGQYMPIYRSDGMPPVMDNNLYCAPPYVQVYPTHPYHPPTQQQVSSASIHYATNQLAALSLQSPYELDSRTIPSTNSMKSFQTNRQFRPFNSNSTDKQSTSSSSIDNEMKSSDQNTR